jgi:hypothetical protein
LLTHLNFFGLDLLHHRSDLTNAMLLMKLMMLREPIWPLLAAAAKFVDLVDEKLADIADGNFADLVDENLKILTM